jgi:uncharacterized protein (TIGR03435 family)
LSTRDIGFKARLLLFPDAREFAGKPTAYFGAVQPLGFKLVRKRSPLEVIVINHLDKPSAN